MSVLSWHLQCSMFDFVELASIFMRWQRIPGVTSSNLLPRRLEQVLFKDRHWRWPRCVLIPINIIVTFIRVTTNTVTLITDTTSVSSVSLMTMIAIAIQDYYYHCHSH